MPHGPAPLTAQLHKALAVGLRYAGASCLHSARRVPTTTPAHDTSRLLVGRSRGVLTRWRGGARPGGDGLRTRVVGSGKSGSGFRPTLSARTRAVGAFMARACGSAGPARQRVVRRMVPGGDGALMHGPQHGKEETDRWNPAAKIFLN
jgi:hypothetical protein